MKRKIIEIDESKCTGCGLCITGCAEGALAIVDGKARIVKDMYCDGLGACIGHCPEGALTIIEREAVDFDEDAAMEHVRRMGGNPDAHGKAAPAHKGCPSAQVLQLSPCAQANAPGTQDAPQSALSHWPVQIRLVPPQAPFLQNADLLIAGDCCPVAVPDFHGRFLAGRVVMVGCPKFDNAAEYVERLAAVFAQSGVKSVTVLEMEVPCCSGLSRIVAEAMAKSGANIPTSRIIVARSGSTHEEPMPGAPLGIRGL